MMELKKDVRCSLTVNGLEMDIMVENYLGTLFYKLSALQWHRRLENFTAVMLG